MLNWMRNKINTRIRIYQLGLLGGNRPVEMLAHNQTLSLRDPERFWGCSDGLCFWG